MGLYKTFQIRDRYTFGLGAMAFNIFNHPNFGLPDNNLGDPTFGQISYTQGVPVSSYGVLLGSDSSVRVVQLSVKLLGRTYPAMKLESQVFQTVGWDSGA
jgi:hypothetical protein